MGLTISSLRERQNKKKANAAKRRAREVAVAPVREDDQDYVDTVDAIEGAGDREEVRSDPSTALQEEARNLGAGVQTTREKSAVKSGVEGENVPRETTLDTPEAASAPAREDGRDYVHAVEATEGGGEVRSDPSSALQEDAQNLRAVEQTTRENSAVKSGVEEESSPRSESTLERVVEAQEARKPGWRHIGRVPGTPDPALTENGPSSRRPLQLPTEVCERIIDRLWNSWMLWTCALVCKAWTPRCQYWMQLHVSLVDRSHVQGYARRARAQPHLLQVRTVWVGSAEGERAPIPQLGTFAMMAAGKLPCVWRLVIRDAIWKPSDFHPLIFVHLSAFPSLTALRLVDVTFPKVREFGRLVCALPSLAHLRCVNVLFTDTAPCASLATTRCPPSVKLTHLVVYSDDETSSNIEATMALIGHLCAAGVVADLQQFEFGAAATSDSNYLDVYREPLQELFKQCSQSLRSLTLSPGLELGKDVQKDGVSDTIASVFDLTCCDNLETVALHATDFEEIGYAWMHRILEFNVSKKLREVSIVMDRLNDRENAEESLQRTVSALKRDVCPQLNELFSNKDYEKLRHVDYVFWASPDGAIPDATRWSTLLKAEMPELDERGALRTRVDVFLGLWTEDFV